MRKFFLFIYIVLFLSPVSSFSQISNYSDANSKFDNLAYMDAVKIFENVARNGFHSANLFKRIGDAYYLNGKYKTAVIWYDKLFKNYPSQDIEATYFFRYSHGLKASNEIEKGEQWMLKFYKKQGIKPPKKTTSFLGYKKGNFKIRKLSVNSLHSDFSPFIYKSTLYFTSSRIKGNHSHKNDSWTNLPFYDIYKSAIVDGKFSQAEALGEEINSQFNESSTVISKDGQIMYFTRNVSKRHEIQKFKLFKSHKKGETWEKAVQLPFTMANYLFAHPALSPEEDKLYFASNLEDSKGASDLYVVDILENNTYSEPVNLGSKINTFGRDTYPFIDKKGNLYYSTDGKPGKGGLDIFKATFSNTDTIVTTVSYGINSNQDDFSYTEALETGTVFFASNRNSKFDVDNIYTLEKKIAPKKKCTITLKGFIHSTEGEPLADATVMLLDFDRTIISEKISSKKGTYNFNLKSCNENYIIRTHKDGFLAQEDLVYFTKKKNKKVVNIQLEPYLIALNKGNDLGKALKLDPIYFDLDDATIKKEAKIELEKIAQAMLIVYPTVKIEIGAHTDSRASDYYNLNLSKRRAKATMNYLISRGVPASRISGKGYGETQLLNKCSNGVRCLEKEHQKNRRTEFIILD
ncbi:MAG: OmpA family protein [Flavobacteriaceae bacterium]|nr:OmpA family protein [Flavobacteriaceae bacterium]